MQEKTTNTLEIVQKSKHYVSVGVGAPGFPGFKYGYRTQKNHTGIDASIEMSTFFLLFATCEADISYLYFSKPNPKKQEYFGVGAGGLVTTNLVCFGSGQHVYYSVFPKFTWGLEFQTERGKTQFIQGQVIFPTLWIGRNTQFDLIPLPSIQYGWMF